MHWLLPATSNTVDLHSFSFDLSPPRVIVIAILLIVLPPCSCLIIMSSPFNHYAGPPVHPSLDGRVRPGLETTASAYN